MRNKTIYTLRIGFIFLSLIFTACSTQKNTFLNRNFHSITTKYNGYFNARESYRSGVKRLAEMHEDNYENVLSVFRYGSEQSAGSVASNMDVAYQKASTAIRRHSMTIRGVEYNRWIDDSFYLIARSHFFKRDYNLSVLTFEYIIRQYDTPLKYYSQVWVAKSWVYAGQYNNALQALERVERSINEGLLDKNAQLLFNMVYADFHLRQENYKQAATYLEQAASLSGSRKQKARLTFILAQAHHQDQNYAQAQKNYARVLKMNPDFQMAFQARINMAMAFDVKTGDSQFILSELKGMLRDSKNRDFRDQIYYALAQFYMRQGKEKEAIEHYWLAIENHKDNASQKGLSFLRLGEIYYNKKDYLPAATYYDSTMVFLSREYDDYQDVFQRSSLLKELATYITTIQKEDSLQRLAALGPNERNAVLDAILADIEEKERKEMELEQERARMRQDMARRGIRQPGTEGEGGWYFYNPSAMNFGQNEFYAKWGERKLEDLWRISNKRVLAFGDTGDPTVDGEQEGTQGGRATRASLMENIPTTPEKMKASNTRLANAYYNQGILFKNQLEDFPNAVKSLEALINRFPDNENVLFGAYFLFTLLEQTGDIAKAQVYRNLIINRYPDTDFAKILSDPNYAENIRARQNQTKVLYERAYEAYIGGNYNLVLQLCTESSTLDLSNEQAAQFSFLRALALGKNASKREFRDQLTQITENYKGTKVHEPATNLLAYLGSDVALEYLPDVADTGSPETTPVRPALDESVFTYKPDIVHFYVVVANTREVQVRQVRNQINIFNRDVYKDNELNMSTLFFDERRQLITVTNFPDASLALKYGNELIQSGNLQEFDPNSIKGFAISVENYPLFYQERKLDDYLRFYISAYPDQ